MQALKSISRNNIPYVVAMLLLLMCCIIFRDYLFFGKLYLFDGVASDTLNYNYPFTYCLSQYIRLHGIPQWSFQMGMGQNLFPFFLRDPFDVLLLLVSPDNIAHNIIYKEILKIILSGIFFFFYLRMMKFSDLTCIAGSLMFSFCAFMIVGSCWYIFSFEALNFSLLLLSFEMWFMRKRWYLLPLPFFLFGISQPFNLYIYGVFIAFYLLLRSLQSDLPVAMILRHLFVLIASAVVGAICSGPFLLENLACLAESPRGSGEFMFKQYLTGTPVFQLSDTLELGATILRIFSSDMTGYASRFGSWTNYLEAPLLYCGLPVLLLLPQAFTTPGGKKKYLLIALFLFFLTPVFFPFLRYAFWLFTGNYYRAYSFFIAFTMLFFALHAFDGLLNGTKVNKPLLITTLLMLFLLLYFPYHVRYPVPHIIPLKKPVLLVVSILLSTYFVLLFFFSRIYFMRYIVVVVIATELMYLQHTSVSNMESISSVQWKQNNGFNDHTIEALRYIKDNDRSFYRIDKFYGSAPSEYLSLNDGMVQGYYGTSSYNPFNQKNYVHYLQTSGIISKQEEAETRWAPGLTGHLAQESQNRVKYFLVKGKVDIPSELRSGFIRNFGDVSVYRNNNVLPLGYTYSKCITEGRFNDLNDREKGIVLSWAAIIKDADTSLIGNTTLLRTYDLNETSQKDTTSLSADKLTSVEFSETSISGKISVERSKLLYLSVPFDPGWKMTLDNKPCSPMLINGGMTGLPISPGKHTLHMAYHLRYLYPGMILGISGILIYAFSIIFIRRNHT